MSLTAAERVRVVQAVTMDTRVRAIVGARPRVIVGEPILEKAQVERYVRVQAAPPPTREVPAILFNVQTNRAASAFATAEGRVLAVEAIPPQLVPFTVDDAAAAFDLVRRKTNGRIRGIDRFRLDRGDHPPRDAYVAQVHRVRGSSGDPCFSDRCADVIFRTPSGYLAIRANVDLTRGTVQFAGSGQ